MPSGESSLGDLVADTMRAATASAGAQIALMNPGGIRADLFFAQSPAGEAASEVTLGEAFSVLPFGNRLVTQTLTGAQLKAVREQQFVGFAGQAVQRLVSVSAGFTFSWSPASPLGSKISNVALNGVPIDPAASYRVTTTEFLASGGDGFTLLMQGTNLVTGGIDLDALIAYLGANSPVAPPVINRVTLLQ